MRAARVTCSWYPVRCTGCKGGPHLHTDGGARCISRGATCQLQRCAGASEQLTHCYGVYFHACCCCPAPPGLKRDDVLGQDLRDLITTALAQPIPRPSTGTLPPPAASGVGSHGGPGRGAYDAVQGPGPTVHLLGVAPRPGPVAAAAPTPASAPTRHVPIPWEQHQLAAAARQDIVLHNVVLPAAAAAAGAGAGPGSIGCGFAPRGPLASLHFRWGLNGRPCCCPVCLIQSAALGPPRP